MFLGNEEKVYIMDKVEGNAAQINGHPAWASVWCVHALWCRGEDGLMAGAGTSSRRRRRRWTL
jgi:hypothetical protein